MVITIFIFIIIKLGNFIFFLLPDEEGRGFKLVNDFNFNFITIYFIFFLPLNYFNFALNFIIVTALKFVIMAISHYHLLKCFTKTEVFAF